MQNKFLYACSFIIIALSVSCNSNEAAKQKPAIAKNTYHFSVPEKWTTEKFPLPPAFAPSITYKGFEDIRFAPGWANPESDDYWTYAFVWYIDGQQNITDSIVNAHLQAYYTGLVASNTKNNINKGKLIPAVASIKKITAAAGDAETYKGDINMQDYMDLSLKQLVLHCTIHRKNCTGNTVLLFLLSPKEETHTVWNSLNKLNTEFNCGE